MKGRRLTSNPISRCRLCRGVCVSWCVSVCVCVVTGLPVCCVQVRHPGAAAERGGPAGGRRAAAQRRAQTLPQGVRPARAAQVGGAPRWAARTLRLTQHEGTEPATLSVPQLLPENYDKQKKCNNKHGRVTFHTKSKTNPEGIFRLFQG